jgi:acyl dehydratase
LLLFLRTDIRRFKWSDRDPVPKETLMSDPASRSAAAFTDRIGHEIGVSRWFETDQARIDAFADVIEDRQFIHVDAERARAETPFEGTIAHGFFILSLLSAMVYDAVPNIAGHGMAVNYGFDRVRFLVPVPAGSRVRGHFVLRSAEERRPGEMTLIYDVKVEIEGAGKPALIAEWLSRQYINNPRP